MTDPIRVTVWNEYRHEKKSPEIAAIYPKGIHGAIADYLRDRRGMKVRTATLDEPDHGLTEAVLADTDVLIWWGHTAHEEVKDEIVERVHKRVLDGMGLMALHSAHVSKIFRKLMGTTCELKWREAGEKERLWVIEPSHPIVKGLGEYIELEHTEMYGERFDVPPPDVLLFVSWFEGGEVFRSGCVYYRSRGKVFYFRPGHETYPIYHNPQVLQVIGNAAEWLAPVECPKPIYGNVQPLQKIGEK